MESQRGVPLTRRGPSPLPTTEARSPRSEEHTSELQSRLHLVCRLLLEKKKTPQPPPPVQQADLCTLMLPLPAHDTLYTAASPYYSLPSSVQIATPVFGTSAYLHVYILY